MIEVVIAHPLLRFCAYVFDSVLTFFIVFSLVSMAGSSTFYITMIDLVIKVAYFTYFASTPPGATIGQRILKIQVIKNDGRLLTISESFDRISMQLFLPLLVVIITKAALLVESNENPIVFATQFVLSIAIIASYSIALFSKQNRTIYDILSDCIVIRSNVVDK